MLGPCSIAPAVVVRSSAFPIEALDGFGDRHLADLAASIDLHGVERFTEAYEQTIARERQALWRETIEAPRFLKALALSSPDFAARVQRPYAGAPRNRPARRLDVTLYRYLARAVGRTEPHDLWAGVSLAQWGDCTRVVHVPPHYAIAPDLRPFRHVVRQLAQRPLYRAKARYRANPTLVQQPDLTWIYWARTESGRLKQRRLDGGRAFDDVVKNLLLLPPLTQLEIAAEVGIDFETLRPAFDTLIAGGALVGGLDLPTSFETVWHALDQVEHELEEKDRDIWHAHVEALRTLCARLEQELDDLDPAAIRCAAAAAASRIAALGRDLAAELPADATRVVLRCDLRAPFAIELGPEARQCVEKAIAAYDRFLETWSPAGLYRQARRRHLAARFTQTTLLADAGGGQAPASAAPQTWQALAAATPLASELVARIADWEALLTGETGRVVCPDVATDPTVAGGQPPLACLLAGLSRGKDGLRLRIRGSLDDVTPLYARFVPLLGRCSANTGLLEWIRTAFGQLEKDFNLAVAELKGPAELHPNASAGPPFAGHAIELWGAALGRPSLAQACVAATDGIPLLHLHGHPTPLMVFACTSADLAHDDPFAQLLLLTSFREPPAAHFQAANLLFESELARSRRSPCVELSDGSVVRASRTVLCGEELGQLVGARSAALRFAAWQQLARRHSWPHLLTIRRDNGSPLMVPRDSPLALEAALAGDRERTRLLVVEELDAEPWLVGPDGRHYTAEIAVPYARASHILDARRNRAR